MLDLHAEVKSTELVHSGTSATYLVTMRQDGAELDLLFLGQTLVRGFTPGRRCAVTGRAAARSGRLVVWNPRYQLAPLSTNPPVSAVGYDDVAIAPRPCEGDITPADARNTEGQFGKDDACRFWSGTDAASAGNAEIAVVAQAGRFRVYLGPAAGVGKTYAMLDEAHRRHLRGLDVVVAVVETHGRPATAAKLTGLQVIPPKYVQYRGVVFPEMDLDAVLARRPELALVDELAHTNVPGSGRNEKRWQDVRDLLNANISVISTVNVQHIESLAEVVEHVTGVPSRERVPDALLRRADQIELVDSSPEQLRRRMLHGNIYPPERTKQALDGFFRTDTLSALRELTLRFLADDIDDKLIDRLTDNNPTRLEVTERILVAVTSTAGADIVLRRAARLATRVKADLYAVHVRNPDTDPPDCPRVSQLRILAEDLDAQWHQVDGEPAAALLEFAMLHRITQMVLGKSSRRRWQHLIGRGSTVRRLTQRAMVADIDLHIVARDLPVASSLPQGPNAHRRA